MSTYWISFSGDHGFLGVAIIDADTPALAIARTHELGINPGGEAMIWDVFHSDAVSSSAHREVEIFGKDRLIERWELDAHKYPSTKDVSEETRRRVMSHPGAAFVCENHNRAEHHDSE